MFDLSQAPYRDYKQALNALRSGTQERARFGHQSAHTPERATHDANELERERLAHMLLLFGVASDVGLIRFLLDAEICARCTDSFQGAGDTLSILSLLLVELGDGEPADLLRFWRAKRANFDTNAGGYDIEFLFCQYTPERVFELLAEQDPQAQQDLMARYDPREILEDLPRWRRSLTRRYPRRVEQLADYAEDWAETFGDPDAQLNFGLQNAQTPDERARLYQRLQRHPEALREWRLVAEEADSAWDQASALRSAMECAAQAGIETTTEARALDDLRHQIPNWNGLGLGRMSTQACYALAATARSTQTGGSLWATARSWHADLDSFTLVGLKTALQAAELWGSTRDQQALQAAHDAEHTRIYGGEE